MSAPTPDLDAFLREWQQDDNEWWRLVGGDHLNLFEELHDRYLQLGQAVADVQALHSQTYTSQAYLNGAPVETTRCTTCSQPVPCQTTTLLPA